MLWLLSRWQEPDSVVLTYAANPDIQPQSHGHKDHHERWPEDAGEYCPAERTKITFVSTRAQKTTRLTASGYAASVPIERIQVPPEASLALPLVERIGLRREINSGEISLVGTQALAVEEYLVFHVSLWRSGFCFAIALDQTAVRLVPPHADPWSC